MVCGHCICVLCREKWGKEYGDEEEFARKCIKCYRKEHNISSQGEKERNNTSGGAKRVSDLELNVGGKKISKIDNSRVKKASGTTAKKTITRGKRSGDAAKKVSKKRTTTVAKKGAGRKKVTRNAGRKTTVK